MHPFISYILRATAVSGILYGYYALALRNRKLNKYNRFYLIAAFVLSLIVPLIRITWYQAVAAADSQVIKALKVISTGSFEDSQVLATNSSLPYTAILWLLYFAVAAAMMGATVMTMLRLYRTRRTCPTSRVNGVAIVETQLSAAPFSFLNTLYWNSCIERASATGARIMKHEMVHIQQHHTIDKLLSSVVLSFFWMNPFFWLLQKELSLVHEFIADEGAIDNQDTAIFAQILLQSHFGHKFSGVIQPFFYSPIKRRLTMLQKTNKTTHAALRRFMVLPVLAGTVLLFSFSIKEKAKVATSTTHRTTIVVDAGHGGSDEGGNGVNGLKEKDISLKIFLELRRLAPDYNIDVVATRESDKTLNLDSRIRTSAGTKASIFLSVHVNKDAQNEPGHKGFEVLVSSNNPQYAESKLLASAIIGKLNTQQVNPNLVEHKGIVVLRENPLPAVLIECGNIDNVKDMAILQDGKQLEQVCRQILAGIAVYNDHTARH